MSIYMAIYDLTVCLRRSKGGVLLYDLLEDMGIRIMVSRFFNRRSVNYNHKHPNEQMKESRRFFRENKERVRNVRDMLEDAESRHIYMRMVMFRCTSDYRKLPDNSMRKQYFGNDFLQYRKGETFIDCGAYDGDTVRRYKKTMKYKGIFDFHIVAFEPDETNFEILKRNHPEITAIRSGVWNMNGELEFATGLNNSTALLETDCVTDISDGEIIKVPVRRIDDIPECADATFIKMDVEGAEYNALLGAQETIVRNRPKLAICIYHSDEDMVRIPELIRQMVPQYKLRVRQHSNSIYETVLYAYE